LHWDAIGAVGEVIGAAGVIISLLYLAVQIRGDVRAKRAATVHDQSAAFRDLLQMLATDEHREAFFQWKEDNLDAHVWHGFEAPIDDMLAYPTAGC
jgi:hypothetical protein